AILMMAALFAALPHPPNHAVLWPKWVFFFLTGLTFSALAYLTDSIVPGLTVHAVSLLTFFVFVWPFDPQRPLVGDTGADAWFMMHVGQAIVFGAASMWAFRRLQAVCGPETDATSRADSSARA